MAWRPDERAFIVLSDGTFFRELRRDGVVSVKNFGRAALFSTPALEKVLRKRKELGIEPRVITARVILGGDGK
jgi:hypothetical protein